MFKMTIAGRLGADAETRFTQGGDSVTGFRVAVDVYRGKQRGNETEWVDVSVWGERGEALAQYLTKGTVVCITGEPGARAYESKQDGSLKAALQLRADAVTLLGGGQRDGEERAAQGSQQRGGGRQAQANRGGPKYGERSAPPPYQGNDPFPDDDLPF